MIYEQKWWRVVAEWWLSGGARGSTLVLDFCSTVTQAANWMRQMGPTWFSLCADHANSAGNTPIGGGSCLAFPGAHVGAACNAFLSTTRTVYYPCWNRR